VAQLFQEPFIVAIGTYDDIEVPSKLDKIKIIFFTSAVFEQTIDLSYLLSPIACHPDDSVHNRLIGHVLIAVRPRSLRDEK